MIIKPKIRGFICTTAHPDGCAHSINEQIDWIKAQGSFDGPKRVLVVGASTGYGLSSRMVAAFGGGADTLGVYFEKEPSERRPATAGWYNSAAFESAARKAGLYADSFNGDAFSDELKAQAVAAIKEHMGQVDLVVYSLASPRRIHPKTGAQFSSVLKPLGAPYSNKTVNVQSGEVSEVTLEPASDEEVEHTTAVMGGEDWQLWLEALNEAGVLAAEVRTVAYTYIGPEVTWPMYRDGTIGKAKDHLEETAKHLNGYLAGKNGHAFISTNKALVTQSSAAIPVVPLYISLLYKVMKAQGTHEGCTEQMYRLFKERLYGGAPIPVDERGRIRVDDLEMQDDVQAQVTALWSQVTTENLEALSDIEGYRSEFLKLFGFGLDAIDYDQDVAPDKAL